MICERCPALATEGYEYPIEYCSLGLDEEYGKEDGCTVNHNKIYGLMRRLSKYEEECYQDCGEWFEEDRINKERGINVSDPEGRYVYVAKHCIGLNSYGKPYKRHGKLWYKPYRNHYDAGGDDIGIWDALVEIGHAYKNSMYHLTPEGFRWLGRILNMKIYEETR